MAGFSGGGAQSGEASGVGAGEKFVQRRMDARAQDFRQTERGEAEQPWAQRILRQRRRERQREARPALRCHAGEVDQDRAGEIAQPDLAGKCWQHRAPRAASETAIHRRSRDWSEIRPEWGLAGCQAFIAAPRRRTVGKRMEGRAFLHDYDWKQDKSFSVLELILTAPVVVASWISLQYYGSTVAPDVFGGGNKLLHNVTGGIGVVEGNGGPLRVGLPWQSVHDGTRYAHDPLRLSVCIEAPREAMSEILGRHASLRALFDNGWLHLFALDEAGRMAWRYAGDLQWSAMGDRDAPHASQPLKVAV